MSENAKTQFALTGTTNGVRLITLFDQKYDGTVATAGVGRNSMTHELDPALPFITLWAMIVPKSAAVLTSKPEFSLNFSLRNVLISRIPITLPYPGMAFGDFAGSGLISGDAPMRDGWLTQMYDLSTPATTKICAPMYFAINADKLTLKADVVPQNMCVSMAVRQSNVTL